MNNQTTSAPPRRQTIKCISLWQPWATLVAIGAKKIETRHWSTSYRGPLAIHAAKTMNGFKSLMERGDDNLPEPFDSVFYRAFMERKIKSRKIGDLPFGAIVAVVDLSKCAATHQRGSLAEIWLRNSLSEQEQAFGDYSANRFGWYLENLRPLVDPIPYKGEQGLFNIDTSLLPAGLLETTP
jgi:hypothetical protein